MIWARKFLLLILLCLPSFLFAQESANPGDDVVLLQPKDELPRLAQKVGKGVKVIDQGFKINCTYDDIVSEAKMKVIKAGGNILKVASWRVPNAISSCYGLKGDAYYVADINAVRQHIAHATDSIIRTLIPDTARYAMLYVYRPNGLGPLVSYNIHLGDSIICRVHNDRYYAIRIYQEGPATIWTRTEARAELPVDLHFGKAYFLRCGVAMGAFVGHPTMRFVDPRVAIEQFMFDKVRAAAEVMQE